MTMPPSPFEALTSQLQQSGWLPLDFLTMGVASLALGLLIEARPDIAAEVRARQEEDAQIISLRALTNLPAEEIQQIAARDPGGYAAVRERVLMGGPVEYYPYWHLDLLMQQARASRVSAQVMVDQLTAGITPAGALPRPPGNRAERRKRQRRKH